MLILCWAVSVHRGAENPFSRKARVVSIPVSKLHWLTKESDRQWTGARQGLAPHSQEHNHSLQQLICSGFCCWTLPLPYFHMKLRSLLIFCRKIIAISHVPVFPSQSYVLTLHRDTLGICSVKGTTDIFLDLKKCAARTSLLPLEPRSWQGETSNGRSLALLFDMEISSVSLMLNPPWLPSKEQAGRECWVFHLCVLGWYYSPLFFLQRNS